MQDSLRVVRKWKPREYQRAAWRYLLAGGNRADLCWHRRSGKDEISLHWACMAALDKPATYWHMLPQAAQARKAIWTAINPHSGLKRIDEAFPLAVRKRTNDHEMFIELVNGATWQVVGSDNFNSLVGSPPAGVVFSEWALADPRAWALIRPILAENNGWAIRIYTPRGKNHAHRGHESAKSIGEPDWFAQRLTVDQTDVFRLETLAAERRELIAEYGETEGEALFQQEYYCSFDAAILGAVYAGWINKAEQATPSRITRVAYDPSLPVYTGWDLGYDDLTAIWWFQIAGTELRLIDYYQNNGQDIDHYADIILGKPYDYTNSKHYGPHDAATKLLAAGGKSVVALLRKRGIHMVVIGATSVQNSIQAARASLPFTWIDSGENCAPGLDALRSYHYKWDEDLRILSTQPVHDWSSHAADAYEIVARVWREQKLPAEPPEPRFKQPKDLTVQQIIELHRKQRRGER